MSKTIKRFVKVKFTSSHDSMACESYYYQDALRTPLKKYDIVLVPTRYGFSTAVVTAVDQPENGYCGNKLKVAERIKSKTLDGMYKKERAKDVEKKLEKAMENANKMAMYEQMALTDPTVSALLAELRELTNDGKS